MGWTLWVGFGDGVRKGIPWKGFVVGSLGWLSCEFLGWPSWDASVDGFLEWLKMI